MRTSHYPNDPALPGPDRRARPVRHRRSGHRVARLPAAPCATTRATSRRGSIACRAWSCATRTTPRSSSGRSATSPATAPTTTRPPAGSAATTPRGRSTTRAPSAATGTSDQTVSDVDLPDVPADRGDRRPRPVGAAAPPADHVRVLARDGQQQRDAGRVLGRDRVDARAPGRLHLGVLGPRPRPGRCPTAGAAGPTAATSATSPTTATSCLRRAGLARPHARSRRCGSTSALAAPVRIDGTASGPRGGPGRDRQPPALPRPRLAAAELRADGRRRRDRRRRVRPAGARARRSERWSTCPAGSPGGRSGRGVPDRPDHHGRGRRTGRRAGFEVCAVQLPLGRTTRPSPRSEPAAPTPTADAVDRRRRRPPRPPASRRAPDPRPVARPDRQRPDRRHGGALGGGRRRPPRRAGWSASSDAAPRRSSAATSRPRPASSSRTRPRYTPLADGERLGRGDRRRSRTRSTTWPASAPCSRSRPASSDSSWFGTGPARDVPGPERGRARRSLDVDRRRTSTCRTSGRRRTAATPTSAGSSFATTAGAGLRIDLDAPRQVSVTHARAADLAAATHDVDLVPCPRRSSSSTPPIAASAPPAAAPTPCRSTCSRPAATPGAGPSRSVGLTDADHLVTETREFHLRNERISYVAAGPRERLARPARFGPALAAGSLVRPHRAGGFAGFANRVGDPVALEYPTTAPATIESRPSRSATPTARPSSTLPTRATGSSPASRRSRMPAGCRRPTSKTTPRPTRSKSRWPTHRAG